MTIETRNAQSAKEAVEILNSLNFRQVNFEFHGENYSNDYEIAYRHFDGVTADGEGTCFGLIEIVIGGKLETVRFINTYRETAVDIKIGNANYTVDNKGDVELIDSAIEEEPKMKTITKKIAKNGAAIWYVDGKRVSRDKALESAAQNRVGNPFVVEYDTEQNHYPVQGGIEKHVYTARDTFETLKLRIDNYHGFTVYCGTCQLRTFVCNFGAKNFAAQIEDAFINGEHGVKITVDGTISILPNLEDYAVTVDAQDAAVEAEIELATAENFKRARKIIRSYEFEGRRYWKAVDDLDEFSRINKATAIAILKEFGLTEKIFLAEQEKFINAEIRTAAAKNAEETSEADVEDYAVTVDAQDAAVISEQANAVRAQVAAYIEAEDARERREKVIAFEKQLVEDGVVPADKAIYYHAETEPATANSEEIAEISTITITEYNIMLSWAEKVSNGQHDAATQIKTHAKKWFNVDADKEQIINIIKTGDLRGFRKNFLAKINFRVEDFAGYFHKLYNLGDDIYVLAEMPTEPKVNEADVEDYAVTVEAQEVATEAETELAANTATEIDEDEAANC